MSDTPKKIRERLGTWLERQRKAAKLVPEVQRAFEDADWQYNALTFLEVAAPGEVGKALDQSLELSYAQLCNSLPLPPECRPPDFTAVTTGVTSSTSAVYETTYTILSSPEHRDTAEELLAAYRTLQDRHGRLAEVRQLMVQRFPVSAAQYEVAYATYMTSRSQESQVPAAASELRNLLDRFKGELWEQARKHPKENMTWATMVERLIPGDKPATEGDILCREEISRNRLYSRLSEYAKRRVDSGPDGLAHLWTEMLDHLYIMCMGILAESARP